MRPEIQRLLAVIGLGLGGMFVTGAIFSVLAGDADWWAAIVVLPVIFVMYRLYSRWLRPSGDGDRRDRDRPE